MTNWISKVLIHQSDPEFQKQRCMLINLCYFRLRHGQSQVGLLKKSSSLAAALRVNKFITSLGYSFRVRFVERRLKLSCSLWSDQIRNKSCYAFRAGFLFKGSILGAPLGVTKFKTLRGRLVKQKHELGCSFRCD